MEETFLDRLKQEHAQLTERVQKLEAFLDTSPFFQLGIDDQVDLRNQLVYMQRYLGVLGRRLSRIGAKH